MPRNLNVKLSDVVVEDDASRALDRLPAHLRKARLAQNKLPQGPNGLDEDDKAALRGTLDPDKPQFVKKIRSILD